jgi:hypothetical protein
VTRALSEAVESMALGIGHLIPRIRISDEGAQEGEDPASLVLEVQVLLVDGDHDGDTTYGWRDWR